MKVNQILSVVWHLWMFGFVLGWASESQAEPTLQVVQTWVLPQEVSLGQPFRYRVRVQLRPGHRLFLPPHPNLGVAQVLQHPVLQRSPSEPKTVRLDMKLAIFQVRKFGQHRLPALWVRVVGPGGITAKYPLPVITVEVFARYRNTKSFHQQGDPQVVLPPVLRNNPQSPSHEWRVVGRLKSLASEPKPPWDPLMVAAITFSSLAFVLFVVGLWLRRKHRLQRLRRAMPPYQVAIRQLEQLNPPTPPTPEALQLYYRQGEQILRLYLQNRLSCQLLHRTGREIPDFLHQHTEPMFPLPDDWWERLRYLLRESESFCYNPVPPGPFGQNLASQIRTLIEPVETQITTLEMEEECLT